MFDPEKFGEAMGAAIREAVAPLLKRIDDLEKDLEGMASQLQSEITAFNSDPVPGPPGKDAEPIDKAAFIKEVLALVPTPTNGKDGQSGADGKDGRDGVDGAKGMDGKDGRDGANGVDGKDGIRGADGAKGADGAGIADLLTDRDGALVATFTDGRMKNLGVHVGKDGADGKDGKDGLSLAAFEMEYLPESHEIALKATAAGRVKELRYPAGGIRPAGYWREGTKAVAGEAWVHDGSLWIATKGTASKPATGDDWIIAARKGRDGERGAKGIDGSPPPPIKLGA